MEVAALEQNQLPLGFSMALAQHPKAMERFSRFTASEKETVLAQARQASSKEERQSLVRSLAQRDQPLILYLRFDKQVLVIA